MIIDFLVEINKQINELSKLLRLGTSGIIVCTCRSNEEFEFIMNTLEQATRDKVRFYRNMLTL